MSGIDIGERKIGWVETRQEDRDECCEVDVVDIKAVDAFQDFSRRIRIRSHRPYGGLQAAHQHPGGNAVPAYIRDDQTVRAIPELEEIEIIAADDLGGTAEGSQFHASDCGHALRQQGALDDLRKLQFGFQSPPLFIRVVIQTDGIAV